MYAMKKTTKVTGTNSGNYANYYNYLISVEQVWDDTGTTIELDSVNVKGELIYLGTSIDYSGFENGLQVSATIGGVNISETISGPVDMLSDYTHKLTLFSETISESDLSISSDTLTISSSLSSTELSSSISDYDISVVTPTARLNFTDADKAALKNNTTAIKAKIIVKPSGNLPQIVLTENDSIKSLEHNDERFVPKTGFLGQFVGRTLDGELQNISDTFSIENREIEFQLGIVRLGTQYEYLSDEDDLNLLTEEYEKISAYDAGGNATTWYTFGNFIVTNPEDNNVADNTRFESMDYTKLFNKAFDGNYTDSEFPVSYNTYTGALLSDEEKENFTPTSVTLSWLAQYTCKQAGVELATTTFTNSSFQVDRNPFQAGEACRDVMKAIGQIAFSWVRVGRDNKCYIDFSQGDTDEIDEYDTITKNEYFSLTTKKEVYGPINAVGFGLTNIDGETAISVEPGTNGDNILYLYDNPLLYTFDLRVSALTQCSVLYGLTYTKLETETVGHPWLWGGELIDIVDMESNDLYTYSFNNTLKYNGHIRSIMTSMDDSEVEQTLGYTSDIKRSIADASINVDKQEGRITQLTKRVTEVEENFDNYYTIQQVNELVEDELGLTNKYITSGGANVFKNTGLWYREGNGFEYWSGTVDVRDDDKAVSSTVMVLKNSTLTQLVNNMPNGTYTISFKYEQLNPTASLEVIINSIDCSDKMINGGFETQVEVTTNSLEFSLTCDIDDSFEIYDLMCNKGAVPIVWSQHANEVRTDTVNISKGITITASTTNAVFRANADGIRIENSQKNTTTNFLDDGMETDNATIKKQAKISGALHSIVGSQTWISGIL